MLRLRLDGPARLDTAAWTIDGEPVGDHATTPLGDVDALLGSARGSVQLGCPHGLAAGAPRGSMQLGRPHL